MKKRITIIIVIIEFFLIGVIIFFMHIKLTNIVKFSLSTIRKENIISIPSGGLKYFYEPRPNTNFKDDLRVRPYQGIYTINSDALNAKRDYSVQKPENTFRIITLGDSYTYGLYVSTKDNWPSVLEDKLNSMSCDNRKKFEVINLGMEGYDSSYEVERFKKRGVKYHPDLVIWLQLDLSRVVELLHPLLRKYGKINNYENKPTIDPNTPWNRAMADLLKNPGYSKLVKYNKNAIESMSNYYKGSLLMVPVHVGVKENEKQMLKDIVSKRNNWIYFDGLRDFFKENAFFADDGHPNQKGHEMIAEDIFNYLKSSGIILCD